MGEDTSKGAPSGAPPYNRVVVGAFRRVGRLSRCASARVVEARLRPSFSGILLASLAASVYHGG